MSTVTIPDTYSAIDLGASGGIGAGKAIIPGALQTLSNNSMFMWGRFNGPVCSALFDGGAGVSDGISVSTADGVYEDLIIWRVPPDTEKRDLILNAVISTGTDTKTLTAGWAGETKVSHSVDTDTNNGQAIQMVIPNPSATEKTFLIAGEDGLKLHSACLTRKTYTNTAVSDEPTASGVSHFRTSRLASTEPLTDELLNRLITNPRTLVRSAPMSMACVTAPYLNRTGEADYATEVQAGHAYGGAGANSDGYQDPVTGFPLFVSHKTEVAIRAFWVGASGSTLRLNLTDNVEVILTPSLTSRPVGSSHVGADVTWSTATATLEKGIHNARGYVDGTHSNKFYLYNLQMWPVEP